MVSHPPETSSGSASRRRRIPSEWIWALAVLVLVALAVGWLPTPRHSNPQDSYSTSPDGKKFFVDLLREAGVRVVRHDRALLPPPGASPGPAKQTLLMLGPARYPRREEWEALHRWVSTGNTLLFAARFEQPEVDLAPFPVQVRRRAGSSGFLEGIFDPDSARNQPSRPGAPRPSRPGAPRPSRPAAPRLSRPAAPRPSRPAAPRPARANTARPKSLPQNATPQNTTSPKAAEPPPAARNASPSDHKRRSHSPADPLGLLAPHRALPVRTDLADAVRWFSRGVVVLPERQPLKIDPKPAAPAAEVLVDAAPGAQAVRLQVGAGQLIVVATDRPFSNLSLLREAETWKVAWGIYDRGNRNRGAAWVCEFLNRTGTPQGVALLFDPAFRPITLQILLCAVLFAWAGSGRYGPPAPPVAPPRRSIVEHAVALGNLQYRARAGAHALRAYLDWWLREMHLLGPPERRRRQVARIAHRIGWNPDGVARLIAQAKAAALKQTLPSEASGFIRQLAALRRAARTHQERTARAARSQTTEDITR